MGLDLWTYIHMHNYRLWALEYAPCDDSKQWTSVFRRQLDYDLEHKPLVHSINLSFCNIGGTRAGILARRIERFRNLTRLNLNFNHLRDQDFVKILSAVRRCPKLVHLHLSYSMIMTERTYGISAITRLIASPNCRIVSLDLMSIKHLQAIKDLGRALRVNRTIQSLNLSYSPLGKKGLRYIAQVLSVNNTLQSLYLSSTEIGFGETAELWKVLMHNTSLKRLSVEYNALNLIDGIEMLPVIKRGHLTSLSLNGNFLGKTELDLNKLEKTIPGITRTEGIGLFIAKILSKQTPLKELFLGCNGLGEGTGDMFAETIRRNPNLTALDLSECRFSTQGFIQFCNNLATNTSLRSLTLESLSLEPEGWIALSKTLLQNTTLTNLSIANGNVSGKKVYDGFKDVIRANISLTSLDISSLTNEDDFTRNLAAEMAFNRSIQTLNISSVPTKETFESLLSIIEMNSHLTSIQCSSKISTIQQIQQIIPLLKMNGRLTQMKLPINEEAIQSFEYQQMLQLLEFNKFTEMNLQALCWMAIRNANLI